MNRLSDDFYKGLFIAAALWNAAVAIPGIAAPHFLIPMIFGDGAADIIINNTHAYLGFVSTMTAIFIFGIGYYLVSRDVYKNRGIVFLGILYKLYFFFYIIFLFIQGSAALFLLLTVTGDFIFSLLFVLFLFQTRDQNI